jgi:tetratricopeptide (TPR) repeat protein
MRLVPARLWPAVPLLILTVGLARAAAPPAATPPYRRLLQGADARRAADLEKQIAALSVAGKFAAARSAAEQVVRLRARVQGASHWQTGDARRRVEVLAKVARAQAERRKAFAALAELEEQARRLWQQAQHARAEPLYRQALATRLQLLGEEHPDTATSYNNLALCLQEQGQVAHAETLLRRALAVRREVLGEEHPDAATSYNNLAFCLERRGKAAQAEPLYRQALAISRRVLGEGPETALSYNNLAWFLDRQGEYARAELLYRAALGEHHLQTARVFNNLAVCLDHQGKHSQAEPLYRQALAVRRALLGERHLETARVHNNLAACLTAQGKLAQAEPLYRKALQVRRELLGERHPATVSSTNNLGFCLQGQCKYDQAEPLLRHALDIRRQVLGERNALTATSYNNLAFCLHHQGKHAQAESLYRKVLALRREVLGERHPDTAQSYDNLAWCLSGQGKHAQAEPLHRKALEICLQAQGEGHLTTAGIYHNLAACLHHQGKPAQAEPLFRKALAIHRTALGEHHPYTASGYAHLAACLLHQDRPGPAERLARQAAASYEGARLQFSFAGLDRAAFASRQSPLPLLAALQARNGKANEAFASLEAGLARALIDQDALRSRPLTPRERQRCQDLLSELARLDRQLGALRRAAAAPAVLGPVLAGRERAVTALAELEAELARKHGPSAGQVYDLATIQKHLRADAALLAWLDDGEEHFACLVRSRGEPTWLRLPGSGPKGAWTPADDRLAGTVRRLLSRPPADGTASWARQAGALYRQRLAALAKHLRAGKGRPTVKHLIVLPAPDLAGIPVEALLAVAGTPSCTVSYAPSATHFAHLLRRSASRPDDRPRLLALGDPAFAAPPSAELPPLPEHGVLLARVQPGSPAARAGLKPGDVLQDLDGSPVKGLADLDAALRRHRDRPGARRELELSVWRAGRTLRLRLPPDFRGVSADRRPAPAALAARRSAAALLARSRGAGFKPLPGSRREVEAVAALFGRAEKLLGEQASEARLQELARAGGLKRYRYLHLATHGVADPNRPFDSFLALADRDLPDPLARVLAGQPACTGRLSAGQILSDWQLDAELVVLSACQSGLGKYEKGEGYVGFAHALFLAGARSLVLSQWEVDDEATALLMVRFYTNLLGKRKGLTGPMGKAEALAEAKEWLRNLSEKEAQGAAASLPRGKVVPRRRATAGPKPYVHPYYWAGFILVGDPR